MARHWIDNAANGDVEKQHKPEGRAAAANPDHDVIRARALMQLFGIPSKEDIADVNGRAQSPSLAVLKEWPGLRGYCQYFERCALPLLDNEYAPVWEALGQQTPKQAVQCWSLFDNMTEAVHKMGETATITKILDAMRPAEHEPIHGCERTLCLIVIFSVLCWSTMMLQPMLPSAEQIASNNLSTQNGRSEQIALKLDTVHRPILTAFRGTLRCYSSGPFRHPIRDLGSQQNQILHVSTLDFESLQTIGKIRIKWVDDLSSHLDFEPKKKTLAIFRFPSFCAAAAARETRGPVFEGIAQALYASDPDAVMDFQYCQQLSQEVLMSYRLLFGQKRGSRRSMRNQLRRLKQDVEYDELLDCLCCEPHRQLKHLPLHLWPVSCRSVTDETLQEEDTYSSQDDFPLLGQRLSKLQDFNLRQQPNKLRDLWRDRRMPLQWYTFWAVIIFGGISIVVALLQLAVAIVAIPVTQAGNCQCAA